MRPTSREKHWLKKATRNAMEAVWKVALGVAGLGAVGFFVFWLLLKQWLSLAIFAQLTKDQTYKLMKLFLLLVFLAVVVAVVAFIVQELGKNQHVSESRLEKAEASFDTLDEKDNVFPTLDVKIRNLGEQTALLTKARFRFEKKWELFPLRTFVTGKVVPPERYTLELPHGATPFEIEKPLAHAVEPRGADHLAFTLTLHHKNAVDRLIPSSIFLLSATLSANANDTQLDLGRFLFLAAAPGQVFSPQDLEDDPDGPVGFNALAEAQPKGIEQNKKIAIQMANEDGIQSRAVRQFVDFYSKKR
jgi:hypothetical protein